MHKNLKVIVGVINLFLAAPVLAGEAGLRIVCKGDDAGAFIYANGQLKGRCPIDIFVPAGRVSIRAEKVEGDYEQLFSESYMLGEDAIQRVVVSLGKKQLTAEAKSRREFEKAAAEQARLQNLRDEAEATYAKASNGDLAAMKKLAILLRKGKGVPKNIPEAKKWESKIQSIENRNAANAVLLKARSGDLAAMEEMQSRYLSGDGVSRNETKARYWGDKAATIRFSEALGLAKKGKRSAMSMVADYYGRGYGVEQNKTEQTYWLNQEDYYKKREDLEKMRSKMWELSTVATENLVMSYKESPFMFTTLGVTYIPSYLTLIPSDLVTMATNMPEYYALQEELAHHPAVVSNPESAVAESANKNNGEEN